jgi:peptide methionine sulfoxide reductase MsrA
MDRKEENAVLGSVYFWRLEADYADLLGVRRVESGYVGYCRAVLAPTAPKLRQKYAPRMKS